MLTSLVIFMVALPLLAAAVPANPDDREIKTMLKRCAEERARLSGLEKSEC